MSKSTHQFEIKGVDKSSGAFNSIKNKATVTASQIRSIVGGAFAAIGGYLSFNAVAGEVKGLARLNAVAQQSSVSVEDLTKTATALNVLGIQSSSVDQLGKAFAKMSAETGNVGLDGFLKSIRELAQIDDVSNRYKEANRIFGESGNAFMPLINAANNGTQALENVINAMIGIPNSAAKSGNETAAVMKIIGEGVHSIWAQALGAILKMMIGDFPGGVRAGAAAAAAWMKYYANISGVMWEATIQRICNLRYKLDQIGGAIGAFVSAPFRLENPIKEAKEAWNYWAKFAEDVGGAKVAEIEKAYEQPAIELASKLVEIAHLEIDLENAIAKTGDMVTLPKVDPENVKSKASDPGVRSKDIKNDLIYGGSNKAVKLSVFGPSYQSESQKQTGLLDKISNKLDKVVSNQEEDPFSDVGVFDG